MFPCWNSKPMKEPCPTRRRNTVLCESQPAIGQRITMPSLRSALLVLCALALCALTVWEGIRVGADRTLPGALARHVNGLAVAVSCLSYGHCHGYTSLQSVDQALYDGGLNYSSAGVPSQYV